MNEDRATEEGLDEKGNGQLQESGRMRGKRVSDRMRLERASDWRGDG